MIKAVLIDVDNTLLDFNLSAERSIENAFNKYGLPYNEKTFPTFRVINDKLWDRIEQGEITRKELHRDRFNIIFKDLGIDFDGYTIEQEFLDQLFNVAIPVDGALETLKYLSEKYKVYTASNALHLQQINRLTISGLMPYVSKTFISEVIGYPKPSPEFFKACFEGIKPIEINQTIMIGDSLNADIMGGKNCGLTTIYFNYNKKPIPEDKRGYCDYVVDNLLEIKNII